MNSGENKNQKTIFLYFVKYPEPGRVKTRLGKEIGFEKAAQRYRSLAESNFKKLTEASGDDICVQVTFDPPEAEEKIKAWLPGSSYRPQQGVALGERLTNAFKDAFDCGAQWVLALGSDTLGLEPHHIRQALDELENSDVVIGPAHDGGYYLIGMNKLYFSLFQRIPWSTSQVLETTLERIRKERLRYFLLPPLEDLDEMKSIIARDRLFVHKVLSSTGAVLRKRKIEILQVNLGKLCNLTCVHCHVESGPTQTKENMDCQTAEAVVRLLDSPGIQTLDITGGAPELNPNFRYLVEEGRKRNLHVMDRCNLTVFYEPGMSDLPDFLADSQVEMIASLPCYTRENVDLQRGQGTFDQSIRALQWLNWLGYGREGTGLLLNLVYNPVGPHLPPPQDQLEADYKQRLSEDFGIIFNRLYTITNMAITRYAKYLKAFNQYETYVELLINSFNPATVEGLMCRNTVSVGWDGKLYDCDFNQALGMKIKTGKPLTIFDSDLQDLKDRAILTADHCFGCTAGAGSSCQGVLVKGESVPGS